VDRGVWADQVFYNGKVVTMDPEGRVAEAVAVRGGRILRVGSSEECLELANGETRRIDLGGRLTLPGLIDTHEHCIRRGLQLDWGDCRSPPTPSKGEALGY